MPAVEALHVAEAQGGTEAEALDVTAAVALRVAAVPNVTAVVARRVAQVRHVAEAPDATQPLAQPWALSLLPALAQSLAQP